MTYAGFILEPMPSFDDWFLINEKDIMKAYHEYCLEAGYNIELEDFATQCYMDEMFGNQPGMS